MQIRVRPAQPPPADGTPVRRDLAAIRRAVNRVGPRQCADEVREARAADGGDRRVAEADQSVVAVVESGHVDRKGFPGEHAVSRSDPSSASESKLLLPTTLA